MSELINQLETVEIISEQTHCSKADEELSHFKRIVSLKCVKEVKATTWKKKKNCA